MKKNIKFFMLILAAVTTLSCSNSKKIDTGNLSIVVNDQMKFKIISNEALTPITNGYANLDSIYFSNYGGAGNFILKNIETKKVDDNFGVGKSNIFYGEGSVDGFKVAKEITITTYTNFPSTVVLSYKYTNLSSEDIEVEKIKTNIVNLLSNEDTPSFWSFQGQTTEDRASWIFPVKNDFYQRNYMGMNNSDYGGGIPVTCLWRKDAGVSIGSLSPKAELISLPVSYPKDSSIAEMSMEKGFIEPAMLKSKESITTPLEFLHVFKGDCFLPLRNFSNLMSKQGIMMPETESLALETAWCAWGYERKFTVKEILGTLPKVKELGIKWVTIDDGYQIAEGDWSLNRERFPNGDIDMINLVKHIHEMGFKAELWWAPLAIDPGTKFLKEHPNSLLEDKDGNPYDVTWWDSYCASPNDKDVIAETKRLVTKFIKEYGFDGLKLDGQHLNAMNLDYNPAHSPNNPEAANQLLPEYFKLIFDTARSIKPDAVIQLCPCGCCFNFYNMPYTNKFVSSDPLNSEQVRTKGYVLRAIAPKTVYYGDHVELMDNGTDFPTQLGIGAVLGTKFTYPKNNPYVKEDFLLTPSKEKAWKHAFNLYDKYELSKGQYVPGYYDIGYDKPETHLIEKDGTLFYAFYSENYTGNIEFRGMKPNAKYQVYDYYNNKNLGEVSTENPILENVRFNDFLLVKLNLIKNN
ncbi:MAG: glycoside hydrolase family 36 protein [Bacteroidales bacterium]